METLNAEKIQELREHQAIPHGGWKLVGGVIVHLLLALMALGAGYGVAKYLEELTTVSWAYCTGGGVVSLALIFINGTMLWRQGGWLRDYWRRDVRGYVAMFWFQDVTGEDGGTHQRLKCAVCDAATDAGNRRRGYIPSDPKLPITICLPLGGWTTEPSWISIVEGADGNTQRRERLAGWSVRLRGIADSGKVTVEIWKHNRLWDVDERIVTDIGTAFQCLEEIATKPPVITSVSALFEQQAYELEGARREREKLLEQLREQFGPCVPDLASVSDLVRRLLAERDAARGEVDRYANGFLPAAVKDRDAARAERDEAAAFIADLHAQFEESARLHDKIQALRIHERICQWLYSFRFPRAWETPMEGAAAQHDADAGELAKVRARLEEHEKRDRTRHGRRQSGASAT